MDKHSCQYCGKEFEKLKSLKGHISMCSIRRNYVPKAKREVIIEEPEPVVIPEPEPEVIPDPVIESKPSLDEFTHSWLTQYTEEENKENETPVSEMKPKQEELVSQTFNFDVETYEDFYRLINNVLDTIIVLVGGDEVYQDMSPATLRNLAQTTKTYADSIEFHVSPLKMLLLTLGVTYAIPTFRATKTIRINRKLLRNQEITPKERQELTKDIKITNIGGLDNNV